MLIPIEDIIVEKSTFQSDVIKRLSESINQFCLLHPITDLARAGKYQLIAGRKRLMAVKEMGKKEIEAEIKESLSPDQTREASLHENLRRYNLPWYEEVALELELHELRIKQHGQKGEGGAGYNKESKGKWGLKDTARELGVALGTLSEDLQIAEALKINPHLTKIKDKTTALKLIKQYIKRDEAEKESFQPSELEMNQVFLGDSLDVLKSIPSEIFDACITDPPWSEFHDDSLTADDKTLEVFKEVFRVMKRDSLLYAFISTTDFPVYLAKLRSFKFHVQKYPLIWVKSGTITHGRRPWEYARDFEPIILAAKGSPSLTVGTEISSIFLCPVIHPSRAIHPNEKPIEVLKNLIKHCTYEGGKILDPFAGSGSTLFAAREMNRKYIGIERERSYFMKIEKRLEK